MLFGKGETTTPNDKPHKPLGFIAQKYESGGAGPGTIADTPGDGGGKAYGIFQLDSAFRHLRLYVAQSEFAEVFDGLIPGSKEFDDQWRSVANAAGEKFSQSQRAYVTSMFYKPAIDYARLNAFSVTERAIQEAVFSISVQHGGWRTILKNGRKLSTIGHPRSEVHGLYHARRLYVQSLRSLSPRVKKALMNRYDLEEQDVLGLLSDYSDPHKHEDAALEVLTDLTADTPNESSKDASS